jgi:catechol 2,3-dioxygenase-like lactoylglutathione lyase family enzyme
MESVIDRLISQFERGTLSRRQLVQMLAMVAVGSPAAAASAKSAPAATTSVASVAPLKTVWLDHISYQVADYKKSVDFYTHLLGWEVKEDTGSQATLDINGIGCIIIRNKPQAGTAGTPAAARPPITGVVDHISWGVEPWDTDTVKAELEKRHLTPVPDMGTDMKSFHVTDPDGWDLQISNLTKDKHDSR